MGRGALRWQGEPQGHWASCLAPLKAVAVLTMFMVQLRGGPELALNPDGVVGRGHPDIAGVDAAVGSAGVGNVQIPAGFLQLLAPQRQRYLDTGSQGVLHREGRTFQHRVLFHQLLDPNPQPPWLWGEGHALELGLE